MNFIDNILDKAKNDPNKCHLKRGIDMEKINTFEVAYGIKLPLSYKEFLNRIGGCMITEYDDSYYIDMTEDEPDGMKMTSFYFFDFEELCDARLDLLLDWYLVEKNFTYNYPFIPIGRTPCQEYLFLVSEKVINVDSPVLMSLNNQKSEVVKHMGDTLESFFNSYISHNGFPYIPDINEPGAKSNFIQKHEVLKHARKEETNKESIIRCNALIKLDPVDPWNYSERASAYIRNGQRNHAVNDINKAIELRPKEGFFYYLRGNLLSEYGSSRKALIDLDIAVKLDPADHLLRSARAEVFYKLGKHTKAVEDCNIILAENWRDELALSTRCRAYRALGEDDKANEDSDLLDDLYR